MFPINCPLTSHSFKYNLHVLILCHFCLTTKQILQCILISMDRLFFHWTWAVCLIFLVCMLVQFSSVQSLSGVRLFETSWNPTRRPPCPSPTPRVYPNSRPLSQRCHPIVSSSVIPFPSCPQSFPESGSLQMSQLFKSGGQNTGVQLQHRYFQWTPRNDL